MPDINLLERSVPVAPHRLAVLDSIKPFGEKVNDHIVNMRKEGVLPLTVPGNVDIPDSYFVSVSCPRFGTGEAKGTIKESVRGCDLYIMTDITNYSLTYTVNGYLNHMSPDDHFQDLKRIIACATGQARRINVIMPFLYESRQHKRTQRESLDCASALQELIDMGVSNIITFDAHDPRVQNAIPLSGFDSFSPSYQFVKALLKNVDDIKVDSDHLMIISPDEGAMQRAVYLAGIMKVDMGMFYKRRDYSVIVNGKNPIISHEFLGSDLTGKDVVVVDDMISSGGSMFDVAKQLKARNARRIIIMTTFGLFTDGLDKFDEFYSKGLFDKIICTNLTYLPPELKEREYFIEADMSKYTAYIIDTLNHNIPISSVLTPDEKIHALLDKYNNR